MWRFFHKLASPPYFYSLSGKFIPWLGALAALMLLTGLYLGLVVAPPDYQQGQSYRIMFVHVPAAWMSLALYTFMAAVSAIHLIWNIKLADVMVRSSAALGASFTFIALATGSLWGKPMWGTWWVWDARLTSELILLFLYLGYIALVSSIEDRRVAARAGGLLLLVGVVNIPIIHYSVEWWNTLHQGPTVTRFDKPAIHLSMLTPLLVMMLAFKLFAATVILINARAEVLERERRSAWVKELEL
ncbi:heme ABC transporter permease [Candidatus Methylospira mobilis]|uniref:Heme exporter protein C n=1 Tax=Candidatus Methylospira mobilis TaxID=1808979 RepID=A0A5Q0BHI6_9GAMM|nr:heme ABC transporter permease [Candidatus Methylospira mobilis]QFY41637.1 heme ABC transporter permease [Candidatus Methylospira mobilis]WNV05112.1 heme ABC transporter permease [Candidatus Methylospira mobilis]